MGKIFLKGIACFVGAPIVVSILFYWLSAYTWFFHACLGLSNQLTGTTDNDALMTALLALAMSIIGLSVWLIEDSD